MFGPNFIHNSKVKMEILLRYFEYEGRMFKPQSLVIGRIPKFCMENGSKNLMKTECVISGTTGGLMDPNYRYKIG